MFSRSDEACGMGLLICLVISRIWDVRTCPFSLMGNDEWNFETSSQPSGKTQAFPFDLEKVFSEKR